MATTIKVNPGEPIPLQAVEKGGNANKVVKVTLINMANGAQIGSVITLTSLGNGAYRDISVLMPSIDYILALYDIYEADGVTPNLTGDKRVSDIFTDSLAIGSGSGSATPVSCEPIEVILDPTAALEIELQAVKPLEIDLALDPPLEIELAQVDPVEVQYQKLSALEVELGVCNEQP